MPSLALGMLEAALACLMCGRADKFLGGVPLGAHVDEAGLEEVADGAGAEQAGDDAGLAGPGDPQADEAE